MSFHHPGLIRKGATPYGDDATFQCAEIEVHFTTDVAYPTFSFIL